MAEAYAHRLPVDLDANIEHAGYIRWDKFLNTFLPVSGEEPGCPYADFSNIFPRQSRELTNEEYDDSVMMKLVSDLYIQKRL